MKNVKGFTLIELVGVIILLAVLALIVIPVVNNSLNDAKKVSKDTQIKSIKEAALLYATTNDLGNESTEQKLSFQTLVDAGFLDKEDILDEKKVPIKGCLLYSWQFNDYNFRYDENCN